MNSENLFILQPMYGTISILRWMICCVSCHAMINSLWFFYSNDGKINNMIAWFQCFRNSDLHKGRPSTQQFREKLPWFLNALPSADCAKGGHGAYSSSVDLDGLYWIFWVLNKPYYVNILLTSVFMAQKSDFFISIIQMCSWLVISIYQVMRVESFKHRSFARIILLLINKYNQVIS